MSSKDFSGFHAFWLFLAMTLSGCQLGKQDTELKGGTQEASYYIKLVLDGVPVTAERVQNEVSAVLADIDGKLSISREDSEISRINAQETTDWLPVSGEIAQLVSIAHTVYEHADGCYDLTLKPLSDLWGFSRHENRIPSQEEIDALLPHVGIPLLEVDAAGQRIRKKDPSSKSTCPPLHKVTAWAWWPAVWKGWGSAIIGWKLEAISWSRATEPMAITGGSAWIRPNP
jgi:thiamine biosynthesis lipoprotein